MKNLDRIYGLSKSQILLDELSSKISLDYFIRSQSNQLLSSYKEKKPNWNEMDSEYIVRIAIFVASKLKRVEVDTMNLLSLSSILKELSSLNDFMVKLKDFITTITIEPRIKSEIQSIITSYAFSLTLYNKYDELWNNLQINFTPEAMELKKIGWNIFLLGRVNLIQRRLEIVECACMLVAVVYVLVFNCESKIFSNINKNEPECLSYLSSMIKGQPDQIKISATHLRRMLELFLQHHIIYSDSGLSGIFSNDQISLNYEKLSLEYIHKLLPSEFDQRLFIENSEKALAVCNHSNIFIFKSCLSYEFQEVCSSSVLFELNLKQKIYSEAQIIDSELWLKSFIEGSFEDCVSDLIFELSTNCGKISSLLDGRILIFRKSLSRLADRTNATNAENFQRVAFVVAIEIMKSVYLNKSIVSLEESLAYCQVAPYDVWKLLKKLTNTEIPKSLYLHLKEQEIVILTNLAWQDKKFLIQFKGFLSVKKEAPQTEFKEFVQELLYYSNYTMKEICKTMNISDRMQEEIWNIFKSSIFTESDILLKRDIHQILVCAIYGLCKAKNLNVTFNSIISRLTSIDPSCENLFRKIQLEDNIGDIIKYYNEEYLKYMKSYLLAIARNGPKEIYTNPLGSSNGSIDVPGISYTAQSPTSLFSPYYTPSSRTMYEFGESPIESLNSFNHMISRNNRNFLSFDEGQPIKRPKLIDDIFQGEEIVENLPEFPGFKED